MTWEEKLTAIQALGCDTCLKMRAPGNWYVSVKGREFKEGSMLSGGYGNGRTPEEAVEDDWEQCSVALVVINAYSDTRRTVRWNGFMWQEASS